jgi:hypothetical protein
MSSSHAAAPDVRHDPAASDAWESVLTRIQRPALLVGGAGMLITVIGLLATPEAALRSYLWAFLYWAAIPLGSLAFLMIQHMTGGTWGVLIRRILEASASLIILTAILWLPLGIAVLAGYEKLYPWLPDDQGHKALGHYVNETHIAFKSMWLGKKFFVFRTLVYFGIWTFLAYYLYAWSGREDRSGNTPKFAFQARVVSAPGILIGALAINFAMLDWVMSLDPSWYSTMFGVLYLVGSGLMTMAFTIVVLRLLSDRKPVRDALGWQVLNDVGNLMFAFTLLWAYVNFSQFLIMWSGNIAEEMPYYYVRRAGSWGAIGLLVVFGHFFLPFLLLLWRKVKRDIRLLAMVAVTVLVMRSVDLFWIVKPMFIQREITLGLVHEDGAGHGAVDAAKHDPAAPHPATGGAKESHPAPGGAEPAQDAADHSKPAAAPGVSHAAPSGDGPVGKYAADELYKSENPDSKYHVRVKGVWEAGLNWTDIPAFLGMGGLFVGAFAWRLKQRPLFPPNDPRLHELSPSPHH